MTTIRRGANLYRNGLVEVRGAFSNRNKAATAARALARPRGAGEPSEFGASEKVVEPGGIEPPTS